MAPSPNHMIPCEIFCELRESKKAASPSIEVYIAKLEGKKDEDEWNMPGAKATITKNKKLIRRCMFRFIAEYNRVSHAAQKMASVNRMT